MAPRTRKTSEQPADAPGSAAPGAPEAETPAAPLTPPAADPVPVATVDTPAAPLTPSAPPAAPAAPPVRADSPHVRQLATPGTEFVDLVWGDNEPGQEMEPADPAELFADPGEHFSYVVVARPLVACIYLPGTVRTSHRLFATAGRRIDRHAAQKITDDLTKARAVQAAT